MKTTGLVVMLAGAALWVGLAALLGLGFVLDVGLTGAGVVAGLVIVTIIALGVVGVGLVLFVIGSRQAAEAAARDVSAKRQRKILDAVTVKGSVRMGDLALELGVGREALKDDVHRLVGLGVFTGYINWEEGVLYSKEAKQLNDLQKCLYCGGEMTLAGKGVVQCKYCGTEYFL